MIEIKNMSTEDRSKVAEKIQQLVKAAPHSDDYQIESYPQGYVISQKTTSANLSRLIESLRNAGFNVEKTKVETRTEDGSVAVIKLTIKACEEQAVNDETITGSPSPKSSPCCTLM